MAKKVEKKVADTLLERTIQVKVGAKVYEAPAPTLGTLVMVSELIADLPEVETKKDVAAMFRNIRHGRKIARICAVFILGAKKILGKYGMDEMPLHPSGDPYGLHALSFRLRHRPQMRAVDALANEILLNCSNRDVSEIVAQLTQASNIDDFFELSTFLKEVSLTKPTKVEETTASGRS